MANEGSHNSHKKRELEGYTFERETFVFKIQIDADGTILKSRSGYVSSGLEGVGARFDGAAGRSYRTSGLMNGNSIEMVMEYSIREYWRDDDDTKQPKLVLTSE